MTRKVGIVGAAVTPFKSRWVEKTYYELAQMAAMGAMHDAGLEPKDVDAAWVLVLSEDGVAPRSLSLAVGPGGHTRVGRPGAAEGGQARVPKRRHRSFSARWSPTRPSRWGSVALMPTRSIK